jgi:hypothetical protein
MNACLHSWWIGLVRILFLQQVWSTVMSQVEWNKKEELVAEQALKHLKQYTQLFEAFTTTARSELALMLKIQEFCYGNMNFMKVFQKIILLFYKSESFNVPACIINVMCIRSASPYSFSLFGTKLEFFLKFMMHCLITIISYNHHSARVHSSVVGWGTAPQAGRSWVWFLMGSFKIFHWLNPSAAL